MGPILVLGGRMEAPRKGSRGINTRKCHNCIIVLIIKCPVSETFDIERSFSACTACMCYMVEEFLRVGENLFLELTLDVNR